MPGKRLILASDSPRRIALLSVLRYPFDSIPHEVEESVYSGFQPADFVQHLAYLKARDVANRVNGEAIILAADTIVVYDKRILGKPKDAHDAKKMLSMLSNSEHEVISGICMLDTLLKKKMLRFCTTYIRIRYISEKEIDEYVKTGEPLDKAGSYAIQDKERKFAERIAGSYSNAVGLPLETVKETLNNFINNTNAEKF
ncbi:MAG: Maf family protein [Candidatus Loosdrechtia sp.]|uniref:Maf family protein n=1 Tax=Candidatus Loosdrechtia sp. TaxID=3101272 RepID=UPI003A771155|nr:MAG: Maf family protein [Candidatus Jettenia sp. AMX2]